MTTEVKDRVSPCCHDDITRIEGVWRCGRCNTVVDPLDCFEGMADPMGWVRQQAERLSAETRQFEADVEEWIREGLTK